MRKRTNTISTTNEGSIDPSRGGRSIRLDKILDHLRDPKNDESDIEIGTIWKKRTSGDFFRIFEIDIDSRSERFDVLIIEVIPPGADPIGGSRRLTSKQLLNLYRLLD